MRLIFSIYDSFANPFYSGGGPVVIHEVAKRLVSRHSITVVTGNYPGAKDYEKDGVRYEHIGLPDRFSSVTAFQFLLPYEMRKRSFDAWIESFTPPYSTAFLPFFTKKPVIGLAHILSADVLKSKYAISFDLYENAGLRLYKNIITQTESIAERIRAVAPKSFVTVIPNGIYPTDFCPLPATEPYILFLGRLEWRQKGLDMLVKAYSLIKDRLKQKLYVAGTGTEADISYLRNLIHSNGLEERVILKGRVDGDDKQVLLANAECVVIPSRYEGMSLVALEAFSFAKPVVCFDIPGFSWTTHREQVLKAKPFDLHDLAQLIMVLTNEPGMRKNMGAAGKALINDLSWDTTARAYEDCISACIQ